MPFPSSSSKSADNNSIMDCVSSSNITGSCGDAQDVDRGESNSIAEVPQLDHDSSTVESSPPYNAIGARRA